MTRAEAILEQVKHLLHKLGLDEESDRNHEWWYVKNENTQELTQLLKLLLDVYEDEDGSLLLTGNNALLLYKGSHPEYWDFDLFEIVRMDKNGR